MTDRPKIVPREPRKRGRKPVDRDEFIRLWNMGLSDAEISSATGLKESSVVRIGAKLIAEQEAEAQKARIV